ncbi:uncharacterized protein LOC125046650 [Penaeus chinensis]|uniref:uncharacterized protein LOC125046650 n=1 Tax=Penaeus chinensis TaxID=139456 RepID=UPI001FB71F70|nr:uncharacterized protein LOC125046650 [Penaeus chinensis]
MQLLRIHYQKLFVCLSFVMLVFVVVRVWDSDSDPIAQRQNGSGSLRISEKRQGSAHENSINIDSPVLSLHPERSGNKGGSVNVFADLFQELAKEETCPLCFGQDLCEDISAGFLTLSSDTPHVHDSDVSYEAHLGDLHKLSVKVPSSDRFSKLDDLVCNNASLGVGCTIRVAASKSYLGRPHELTSRSLYKLLHHIGITRRNYPFLMCPSKKLLTVVERTFDENDDHELTQDERLYLYTTLAIAPEIVVLKLLTKANLNVGFPRLVGVCGRLAVLEEEMTPLSSMLDEPFNVRASLAAQILTMIDDFMEDHPEWYLFYASWSIEKLAVNKEGEVVLIDLANMAIIDKSLFRDDYEDTRETQNHEVCNKDCFQKFTSEIYREGHDTDEMCSRVEDVGHLMYAAVCAMILSDMKQHKYVDYFSSTSGSHQQPRMTRGLLHNIPAADRATVEELLAECVEEAAPGGRLQAAQELRDFLSDFLLDEEDEEGDEDEEDDTGDNGEDYDDDYEYEDYGTNKEG